MYLSEEVLMALRFSSGSVTRGWVLPTMFIEALVPPVADRGLRPTNPIESLACMDARWTLIAAILAGLAVGTGAFGAHGIDRMFAEKYRGQTREVAGETVPLARKFLQDFKTGAEYQMYHALGLLGVAAVAARRPSRAAQGAGWCLLLGCLLFSGSLYLLTLTGVTKWGAVTPIGGVLFLVGWLLLALAAVQPEVGTASDPPDAPAT